MLAAAIVAECRLPGDAEERVFALVDAGPTARPQWRLTLRSRGLGARTVELPLADAQVDRRGGHVRASARSANGGLDVEFLADQATSRLAVFVNFELEVNVWRDLSPEVERMNTDGPREAQCVVLSERAPMP